MPCRTIEAAGLTDTAFIRATELLRQIRAANPGLSFRVACQRALRQAYLEGQDRQHAPHKAA